MKTKTNAIEKQYYNMFEQLFVKDNKLTNIGVGYCFLMGIGLLFGLIALGLNLLKSIKRR